MNDLRTAAQQALEALEDLADCGTEAWSEQRPCVQIGREAITALRSALAQQAEPAQEPVAYFGSAYVNENGVHITTVLGPVAIPQDAKLYTAPPQRKPLTLEEAQTLLKAERIWLSNNTAFRITRVVERAHGIKE